MSKGATILRGEHKYRLEQLRFILPHRLGVLVDLFIGGGITIRTTKRNQELYLYTLIQPDGDILNLFNEDCSLTGAEEHKRLTHQHLKKIEQYKRDLMGIFDFPKKALGLLAGAGAGGSIAYDVMLELINPSWADFTSAMMRVMLITVGTSAVYGMGYFLLKSLLRRKINQMLALT